MLHLINCSCVLCLIKIQKVIDPIKTIKSHIFNFQPYTPPVLHSHNPTLFQSYTLTLSHSSNLPIFHSLIQILQFHKLVTFLHTYTLLTMHTFLPRWREFSRDLQPLLQPGLVAVLREAWLMGVASVAGRRGTCVDTMCRYLDINYTGWRPAGSRCGRVSAPPAAGSSTCGARSGAALSGGSRRIYGDINIKYLVSHYLSNYYLHILTGPAARVAR